MQYSVFPKLNKNTTGDLCFLRLHYNDDLDYEVRTVKDTLMKYKFGEDSLLTDQDSVFIIKNFCTEFSRLKNDFNNLYKCHRNIADEYTHLKKACISENGLSRKYMDNLEVYQREIMQYTLLISKYGNRFDQLKKICRGQMKPSLNEQHAYMKEKSIELHLFHARSDYISKHYNALMGISKKQKNRCGEMDGKINRLKKKYQKKQS